MENNQMNLEESKLKLITENDRWVNDKIIEKSNADLLKKLIGNAETLTEAIAIAELGTTYKRTGLSTLLIINRIKKSKKLEVNNQSSNA